MNSIDSKSYFQVGKGKLCSDANAMAVTDHNECRDVAITVFGQNGITNHKDTDPNGKVANCYYWHGSNSKEIHFNTNIHFIADNDVSPICQSGKYLS